MYCRINTHLFTSPMASANRGGERTPGPCATSMSPRHPLREPAVSWNQRRRSTLGVAHAFALLCIAAAIKSVPRNELTMSGSVLYADLPPSLP